MHGAPPLHTYMRKHSHLKAASRRPALLPPREQSHALLILVSPISSPSCHGELPAFPAARPRSDAFVITRHKDGFCATPPPPSPPCTHAFVSRSCPELSLPCLSSFPLSSPLFQPSFITPPFTPPNLNISARCVFSGRLSQPVVEPAAGVC